MGNPRIKYTRNCPICYKLCQHIDKWVDEIKKLYLEKRIKFTEKYETRFKNKY